MENKIIIIHGMDQAAWYMNSTSSMKRTLATKQACGLMVLMVVEVVDVEVEWSQ